MDTQPYILPPELKQKALQRRSNMKKVAVGAGVLFAIFVGFNLLAPKPSDNLTPAPIVSASPSAEPSEPTPAPEVTSPPLYADCKAVWEELERPIFKEDEGYRESFDWDADGVGCEDNPTTTEDEAQTDWASVRERFRKNLEGVTDFVIPKAKDFWTEAKDFLNN